MIHDLVRGPKLLNDWFEAQHSECDIRTRPFEASSNLTGHSRTDAKKQNDAGFAGLANGYQAKSNTGLACENATGGLNDEYDASKSKDCGLWSVRSFPNVAVCKLNLHVKILESRVLALG